MTILIALFGPAGAGKSLAASILVERWGARRFALADPLKDLVRDGFSLTEAQVRGTQAEKEAVDPRYGVSARWLLQRVGTDGLGVDFWAGLPEHVRRTSVQLASVMLDSLDEDYLTACYADGFRVTAGGHVWIDAMLRRVREAAPALAVVEDARFLNEGAAICAFDRGVAWRVLPPADMGRQSTDDGQHVSEREWRDVATHWVIQPRRRGAEYLTAAIAEALDACQIHLPTGVRL